MKIRPVFRQRMTYVVIYNAGHGEKRVNLVTLPNEVRPDVSRKEQAVVLTHWLSKKLGRHCKVTAWAHWFPGVIVHADEWTEHRWSSGTTAVA